MERYAGITSTKDIHDYNCEIYVGLKKRSIGPLKLNVIMAQFEKVSFLSFFKDFKPSLGKTPIKKETTCLFLI